MSQSQQEHTHPDIAELEARARELQRELSLVQAQLAALNSGTKPAAGREVPLAPTWDAPIPISSPPDSRSADSAPASTIKVYLQSLQPYHALRTKWQLGSGLESALTPAIDIPDAASDSTIASDLRLFGLLSNGQPCEMLIPFAQIARDGGIILGRAPEDPAFTIDDPSISRNHLRLHLDEYGLVVSDLGSTNGTAVNGASLSPYDNNRPLQDADMLTIGNIQLQIEFI